MSDRWERFAGLRRTRASLIILTACAIPSDETLIQNTQAGLTTCMLKSVWVNTCVPSLRVCLSLSIWMRITDIKTTCQPWVAVSGQPCHTAPGALLRRSFVPGPASRQLHATAHHAPRALPAAPPERGAMWDTSQSAGWCLPPAPPLLPLHGSPSLPDWLTLSARLKSALILSLSFTLYPTVSQQADAPSASLPQPPNNSLCLLHVWLSVSCRRSRSSPCLSFCLTDQRSISFFLPDHRSPWKPPVPKNNAVNLPHTHFINLSSARWKIHS